MAAPAEAVGEQSMAFSSGTKSSMQLAIGWCVAAVMAAGVVTHFEEVRTALGLKLDIDAFEPVSQAYPARQQVAAAQRSDRTVEIRAGSGGHFETRAHINGRPVDVMVDTGATAVALTWEDARAAGIHLSDSDFRQRVSTANGTARVAAVMLDSISIEDITVRNVRAVVAEAGKLQTTLLGMSFLSRLGKAEMSRGTLILSQ